MMGVKSMQVLRWMAGVVAIAALATGCGESAPPSQSPSPAESPAASPSPDESSPSSTTAEKPDVNAIFGTKQDGWLPKVLADAKLTHSMTPEAVGKIYPGAEKTSGPAESEFTFSEAKAKDVVGVQGYKFSFQNSKLYSTSLIFDPKLNSDEFFNELVKTTTAKYGEVKPDQIEKKLLIWVGSDFASATLSEGLSDFEGYEFKIVMPKD